MKITIKYSTIVRPSQETPNQRLWLSNSDLIFPPFYASAAYVYKSDGSPNFMDTKLLKESLSKVLVTFYPLAGRLGLDDNGRRELHCNGDGVLFVEAETDYPLGDFADFADFNLTLFPAIDPQKHFSSFPLLLLQVTRFSCGGVYLGYRIHHNVVDAEGTTHFFNSWAEHTRGQPISVQPVFDRSFLRGRDTPNPKFHHVEYDPPPPNEVQDDIVPLVSSIKVPIDLINALKSKVSKEDGQIKCSTFEILTAHLWRCSIKARNLDPNQVSTLRIPINCRNKVIPAPPKGFCGNIVFYVTALVTTGELLSEPLVKTVKRIRKTIKKMNNEYLWSSIDYLEENNNGSDRPRRGYKYQGFKLRRGIFFVNSWATIPIFKADFGWGKPLNMVPPKILEGMANFLPCFNGENDLPVVIALQEKHMKFFETLLYSSEVISKM